MLCCRILTVLTNDTNCEFLKISCKNYVRVIEVSLPGLNPLKYKSKTHAGNEMCPRLLYIANCEGKKHSEQDFFW